MGTGLADLPQVTAGKNAGPVWRTLGYRTIHIVEKQTLCSNTVKPRGIDKPGTIGPGIRITLVIGYGENNIGPGRVFALRTGTYKQP
jgi:hypothetical protein